MLDLKTSKLLLEVEQIATEFFLVPRCSGGSTASYTKNRPKSVWGRGY